MHSRERKISKHERAALLFQEQPMDGWLPPTEGSNYSEERQRFYDPKIAEYREKWLSDHLATSVLANKRFVKELVSLQPNHVDALVEFFVFCLNDSKHAHVQALAAEALSEDLVAISLREELIDPLLDGVLPTVWKIVEDKMAPPRVRECSIECLVIAHILQLGRLSERETLAVFTLLSTFLSTVSAALAPHKRAPSTTMIDQDDSDVSDMNTLLALVLDAWGALLAGIPLAHIDEHLPKFVDDLEAIILRYEHGEVVASASEAFLALIDLNSRLPEDDQYEIEIDRVVKRLEAFKNLEFSSERRARANASFWGKLVDSLECDYFSVALPWLKFEPKGNAPKIRSPDKAERRKAVETRTGWAEALSLAFVRDVLGNAFNTLLRDPPISYNNRTTMTLLERVGTILDRHSNWANVPSQRTFHTLPMFYPINEYAKPYHDDLPFANRFGEVNESGARRKERRGKLARLEFD